MKHPVVYILESTTHPNKVYTGYTSDLEKRLRQHNGLYLGGAKSTRRYRPWKVHCYVDGFESSTEALKFEYKIKHKRKGTGISGRIATINRELKSYLKVNYPLGDA